ncbi:DUF4920 domain-containing protein [Gracilimonas halophila]|uniref:DUF4920 domain-containing protein n=1 Tax=Gracilimonas halophila TaxID=1834464 RepID=A0ABW5JL99_9BACT
MKKLLILVFTVLSTALFAQNEEIIRLSEPVAETETYEVFGAEVSSWNEPIALNDLISNADVFTGKEITLETEVAEVCEKKGCFFIANDGNNAARITFKDYGFFIPTDSKGKTVKLIGTFEVKTLSEDQAKHHAEDAGENPDAIQGSQEEYSIIATSVLVPKS